MLCRFKSSDDVLAHEQRSSLDDHLGIVASGNTRAIVCKHVVGNKACGNRCVLEKNIVGCIGYWVGMQIPMDCLVIKKWCTKIEAFKRVSAVGSLDLVYHFLTLG